MQSGNHKAIVVSYQSINQHLSQQEFLQDKRIKKPFLHHHILNYTHGYDDAIRTLLCFYHTDKPKLLIKITLY